MLCRSGLQGTTHRLMAEVLLEEIGRRPGPASKEGLDQAGEGLLQGVAQEREGYALAAGAALGLIVLGKGRSAGGQCCPTATVGTARIAVARAISPPLTLAHGLQQ